MSSFYSGADELGDLVRVGDHCEVTGRNFDGSRAHAAGELAFGECPTTIVMPSWSSSTCCSRATSSASEDNGNCGAGHVVSVGLQLLDDDSSRVANRRTYTLRLTHPKSGSDVYA